MYVCSFGCVCILIQWYDVLMCMVKFMNDTSWVWWEGGKRGNKVDIEFLELSTDAILLKSYSIELVITYSRMLIIMNFKIIKWISFFILY